MRKVYTPKAPKPAGHYSQAVIHDNLVYVSGQMPINPATGEKQLGSIEEQTQQVLQNIAEILTAAGSDITRIIKTTVYISDIRLWDRVNAVYGTFFGEHLPARSVVPTQALHHGFSIEIEAIGSLP